MVFSGFLCKVPPEDRSRALAFSKYLYLPVQTSPSHRWDRFPVPQIPVRCRRRREPAGLCQLRAHARQPQGVRGPAPPSGFILPIHRSALFNHREGSRETFHGTGKGLSRFFLKEVLVSRQVFFCKIQVNHTCSVKSHLKGVEVWEKLGFGSQNLCILLRFPFPHITPSTLKSPEMS